MTLITSIIILTVDIGQPTSSRLEQVATPHLFCSLWSDYDQDQGRAISNACLSLFGSSLSSMFSTNNTTFLDLCLPSMSSVMGCALLCDRPTTSWEAALARLAEGLSQHSPVLDMAPDISSSGSRRTCVWHKLKGLDRGFQDLTGRIVLSYDGACRCVMPLPKMQTHALWNATVAGTQDSKPLALPSHQGQHCYPGHCHAKSFWHRVGFHLQVCLMNWQTHPSHGLPVGVPEPWGGHGVGAALDGRGVQGLALGANVALRQRPRS